MSSYEYANLNETGIESERAERLMRGILKLEETNNKTKSLSDQEMVRKIVKLIEEEVDCY
jgi:hypothetical protein